MNKKIGLLPWEKYEGRANIGSSRIRGYWVVNHWADAEIFKMGKKYETVIFQKCYWTEYAELFNGIKILDLCDPDWLHWGYRVKRMVDSMDAITTSTEALAIDIRNFTDKPVLCIPDRLDFDTFKIKKVHEGDAKTVVWYGYSSNTIMLDQVLYFLDKLKLDLIVISDKNYLIPKRFKNINLTFIKYKPETINSDILKGDIVVNPTSAKGKWKYKSKNKTINAWGLGMPVATNPDELRKFISCDERINEVKIREEEIKNAYDVKLSVKEYEKLIETIKESKK